MTIFTAMRYQQIISEICALDWQSLTADELLGIARAYYYFSIQFRESLVTACDLRPGDDRLEELVSGECDTDNLSPFPGVAAAGERLNHDEFMRRLLQLSPGEQGAAARIDRLGMIYLESTRRLSPMARALSISSYEDGGLEAVFKSILRAPNWSSPALAAFRHFLVEHIRFDSDPTGGHGALSRHLVPDDRILPLWLAVRDLLIGAVPRLESFTRNA